MCSPYPCWFLHGRFEPGVSAGHWPVLGAALPPVSSLAARSAPATDARVWPSVLGRGAPNPDGNGWEWMKEASQASTIFEHHETSSTINHQPSTLDGFKTQNDHQGSTQVRQKLCQTTWVLECWYPKVWLIYWHCSLFLTIKIHFLIIPKNIKKYGSNHQPESNMTKVFSNISSSKDSRAWCCTETRSCSPHPSKCLDSNFSPFNPAPNFFKTTTKQLNPCQLYLIYHWFVIELLKVIESLAPSWPIMVDSRFSIPPFIHSWTRYPRHNRCNEGVWDKVLVSKEVSLWMGSPVSSSTWRGYDFFYIQSTNRDMNGKYTKLMGIWYICIYIEMGTFNINIY